MAGFIGGRSMPYFAMSSPRRALWICHADHIPLCVAGCRDPEKHVGVLRKATSLHALRRKISFRSTRLILWHLDVGLLVPFWAMHPHSEQPFAASLRPDIYSTEPARDGDRPNRTRSRDLLQHNMLVDRTGPV